MQSLRPGISTRPFLLKGRLKTANRIHTNRNPIMYDIPQLTPQQLQDKLSASSDILLLDVREPEEAALCRLPNSILIPMNELSMRQNELPDGKEIIVYCHHGIRSQYCALYLADAGFEQTANLKGGIDAWAREIDPAIPRY